ncbi:Lar family restriction alleviation protein [Shinella sp. M31]|uniref:Lar family restriction alleviation protein n=1 Tax=Shinella sp. M31 TaxID=3368615 RepID=UPI003BA35364
MGENVKLASCPFCGSDRVTVWNIRDGQQAICKECKSTGAPTFYGPDGRDATWRHAVEAWNRRSAYPNEPAPDDLVGYVLRYGGRCRDCADMDGVCQSGQPCDTEQRRAVVKHTIKALAYGIKHGFIENPFIQPPSHIDAEPELLEAAKNVYEWMNGLPIPTNGCTAKMQVLYDAIAKAEARP